MKTKFYKRLVPIALIASMAVTNVGMTSAGAQEVISITQSSGAPIVETPGVASTNVNVVFEKATDEEGIATIEITEKDEGWTTEANFRLYNSTNQAIGTNPTIDGNSVSFTVALSALTGTGNTLSGVKLYYVDSSDLDNPNKKISDAITLTAKMPSSSSSSGSGTTTTSTVAAGDVFQIPGGLVANSTKQETYKVGVKKLVGADISDAALGDNEIQYNKLITAAGATKNVLGTWENAYDGETDSTAAMNLKPEMSSAIIGKYVLYYSYKTGEGQSAVEHPVYVRLLSEAEQGALPYTWKTIANLTAYEDKDKGDSAKVLATEKGVLEKFISNYIGKYYFNADSDWTGVSDSAQLSAVMDLSVINSATTCYWGGVPAALVKADSAYKNTDGKMNPGQIELPEVKAPEKKLTALTAEDDVIKKVIEVYDSKHSSAKFASHNDGGTSPVWVYTTAIEAKDAVGNPGDPDYEATVVGHEKGEITTEGWAELATFAAANLEACFGETDMYAALKARAEALYLNYLNKVIHQNHNYDLTALHWVLETKGTASEEVTTKSGKKTEYTKTSSAAKFWGKKLKKVTDKKTKVTSWKAEEKDSSCARVQGASVEVSNTKASGNFNSSVYIKAVTDSYDTPTANVNKTGAGVILKDSFYIPPAVPTAFTDKSLNASKSAKGVEFASVAAHFDAANAAKRIYTLTLDVGKSYKLPFALKDGKDKSLVYEMCGNSHSFTVINGKVTGYAANDVDTVLADTDGFASDETANPENYIKVYSRTSPDVCAYVQVKVKPAVKSIVTNAKKVGMWKGAKQYISLGTSPALNPADVQYIVENGDTATYTIKGVSAVAGDGTITYADPDPKGVFAAGINYLEISTNEEKEPTSADITVNVVAAGKTTENLASKPLTVKLVPVTTPQDIKTVKCTVKTDKNGYVNIPVGSAANLGFTVTPVGAPIVIKDSSGHVVANGDTVLGSGAVYSENALSDTFKIGKNASKNGENASSSVGVNTYEPGASIILTDDNYTIKGGFLMTSSAAATDCDREFKAGNKYTMSLPKTAGEHDEEITWTANNPSAVKFEVNGPNLEITPCQTGTFTITGTTQYTKQKLSFKMLVGAKNDASDITNVTKSEGGTLTADVVGATLTDEKYVMNPGTKATAFLYAGTNYTNGVGGPVTFALKDASKKNIATVTKNGVITAKSGGEVVIVATMTKPDKSSLAKKEITVKVNPVTVYVKSYKAPVGVIKNTEFALSASLKNFNKNTMELKWVANDGSNDIDLTTMPKDKASGKVKFAEPGTYTIHVLAYDKTDTAKENNLARPIAEEYITVKVYDKAVTSANTFGGDADAKKAISALGAKYEDTDAKKNNGVGYGYVYIPIYLSTKDTSGKTVNYGTTDFSTDKVAIDDFVWTSSNKNLAKVMTLLDPADSNVDYTRATGAGAATDEYVEESDIIKGYKDASAVAKIKVANNTDNHYTGVVTIKGVTKNSKKTISIKLNVLDKKRTFVAEYNPQTFENNAAKTLANIDDSAVKKELANVGDATAITKAISDAAEGKKKDKTFVMNKWVLVNSTNLKEVNKDTEHKVAEPYQATVVKDSGSCTVNFNSASMTNANGPVSTLTAKAIRDAASVTDGTWYLAVAEVTYKVKQVHEDAVEESEGVQPKDEKPLLLEETGIKVTNIASKTPIVKATS